MFTWLINDITFLVTFIEPLQSYVQRAGLSSQAGGSGRKT